MRNGVQDEQTTFPPIQSTFYILLYFLFALLNNKIRFLTTESTDSSYRIIYKICYNHHVLYMLNRLIKIS